MFNPVCIDRLSCHSDAKAKSIVPFMTTITCGIECNSRPCYGIKPRDVCAFCIFFVCSTTRINSVHATRTYTQFCALTFTRKYTLLYRESSSSFYLKSFCWKGSRVSVLYKSGAHIFQDRKQITQIPSH